MPRPSHTDGPGLPHVMPSVELCRGVTGVGRLGQSIEGGMKKLPPATTKLLAEQQQPQVTAVPGISLGGWVFGLFSGVGLVGESPSWLREAGGGREGGERGMVPVDHPSWCIPHPSPVGKCALLPLRGPSSTRREGWTPAGQIKPGHVHEAFGGEPWTELSFCSSQTWSSTRNTGPCTHHPSLRSF